MNATIHPRSYATTVRCSNCGAEHDLRSTREDLRIDVCSAAIPSTRACELRASRGGQIARFEARRRLARRLAQPVIRISGEGGMRVEPCTSGMRIPTSST